jgi:hypothetical protein
MHIQQVSRVTATYNIFFLFIFAINKPASQPAKRERSGEKNIICFAIKRKPEKRSERERRGNNNNYSAATRTTKCTSQKKSRTRDFGKRAKFSKSNHDLGYLVKNCTIFPLSAPLRYAFSLLLLRLPLFVAEVSSCARRERERERGCMPNLARAIIESSKGEVTHASALNILSSERERERPFFRLSHAHSPAGHLLVLGEKAWVVHVSNRQYCVHSRYIFYILLHTENGDGNNSENEFFSVSRQRAINSRTLSRSFTCNFVCENSYIDARSAAACL